MAIAKIVDLNGDSNKFSHIFNKNKDWRLYGKQNKKILNQYTKLIIKMKQIGEDQ